MQYSGMSRLRQSAAVLIPNELGRVLMVRQAYRNRRFGFPGGAVDEGESPERAAVREAKEEAGIEVKLEYLIGRYLLRGGGKSNLYAFVYCGRITSGLPAIVDPLEIAYLDWFAPASPPAPLLDDAAAALEDWSLGKRNVHRERWRTPTDHPRSSVT